MGLGVNAAFKYPNYLAREYGSMARRCHSRIIVLTSQ
jgi:hypothetical protein